MVGEDLLKQGQNAGTPVDLELIYHRPTDNTTIRNCSHGHGRVFAFSVTAVTSDTS